MIINQQGFSSHCSIQLRDVESINGYGENNGERILGIQPTNVHKLDRNECSMYTIWLFNSSPWNIHPFLRTVNHLFQWAIYTMAMLVITRGYIKLVQLEICYVTGTDSCTSWMAVRGCRTLTSLDTPCSTLHLGFVYPAW